MRGVGLALEGRHAGALGVGRLEGLAAALGGLLDGSADGEVPGENASASGAGRPLMDSCLPLVAAFSDAGGELEGENGPWPMNVESGGEA